MKYQVTIWCFENSIKIIKITQNYYKVYRNWSPDKRRWSFYYILTNYILNKSLNNSGRKILEMPNLHREQDDLVLVEKVSSRHLLLVLWYLQHGIYPLQVEHQRQAHKLSFLLSLAFPPFIQFLPPEILNFRLLWCCLLRFAETCLFFGIATGEMVNWSIHQAISWLILTTRWCLRKILKY